MERYFVRSISAALLGLSSLLALLILVTSLATVPTRPVEARESHPALSDPGSSAPLNIPLVVTEDSGLGRTQEPINSGIPLPFGVITDTNDLWLAGPDGATSAPAQFTVLSRWNGPVEDSAEAIKRVPVDFQGDVPQTLDTESQPPQCPITERFTEHPQGSPFVRGGEWFSGWDPFVLHDDDGKYKVWYTLWANQTLGIAYAESNDGVNWLPRGDGSPVHVLTPTPGAWDEDGMETVSVLKKDGQYMLWYLGYPCTRPAGEYGRHKCIGLATSQDGITWEKHPTPVLTPTQAWEQPFSFTEIDPQTGQEIIAWDGGVQEPSVLWDEEEQLFKMWYEAKTETTLTIEGETETVRVRQIGYATSQDGITWNKYAGNPVFRPLAFSGNGGAGAGWEDPKAVGHTNVIRDPQQGYHLFYSSRWSIGHAYSADGLQWERNPQNPLLPYRTNEVEGFVAFGGPSAILENGAIRLYHMRSKPGARYWGDGGMTIGLATGQCASTALSLENDHLRLDFQRQAEGNQTWGLALQSATVKPTAYTFGFDLNDLWAITLRATDATTTTLTPSTSSYTLTVTTSAAGPTQTLTAVWQNVTPFAADATTIRHPSSIRGGSLTVTATVSLGPDDPYALWTIAVDNRYPDQAVHYVDFPRLKVQPVGAPETNRAAVPFLGGRLIYDPIHHAGLNALLNLPPFFRYPYMYAPLQLFTYFDTADAHALYLAAHDGGGYIKKFDFRADGRRLYFGVRQYPEYNITPGNDYPATYPVAIGALPGDWYDAAKTYRAWAQKQVWMQRGPIALSDDFSDKLKASDVMGVWEPMIATNMAKPFKAVAEDMERWADFLGIERVSGLWYGWHDQPMNTGWPEYKPVKPSFADGMTLTHSLGNYAWPYINTTGWDIATPSYTATVTANAMKDEEGNVRLYTLPEGGGTFALMDPATEFWQKYVRDWVLRLQRDYGVDGVYLDEWSGNGDDFDYDPSHDHPTGGGNYVAQGMRTQGRMIREAARAQDPEFIMMSEHPGELFIDLLEIENVEYLGPLNLGQWWALPLFNTVYHDYIMMSTFVNTSSIVPNSPDNETALSWMWAVRYAQGNLLAVNAKYAPVLQDPVESTPNYGAYLFLRELVQSYAYAAPYLRYGERLRELPADAPTRRPPSLMGVPWVLAPYSLDQPVILSSAWRSVTDDSVGLVFANWVTTTESITYTFDPGKYGLPGGSLGLYRLDDAGPHLLTTFSGPITRTETLPPRSSQVLMVAPCPCNIYLPLVVKNH